MVKEFTSASAAEVEVSDSSALEPLVIADLYAPSNRGLDEVAHELMSTYLSVFRRSPLIRSSLALVFGDILLVVRGKVVDILYRLYDALQRVPPEALFGFTAPAGPGYDVAEALIKSGERPHLAAEVLIAAEYFSRELLNALIKAGVIPPKPYTVIHSRPLAFRYGIIKHFLQASGFRHFPPGATAAFAQALKGVEGGSRN